VFNIDNDDMISIACDMRAENCFGDFTANRLWYDASNQIIWDPTGTGVHDAVHRLLRLPVPFSERNAWAQQNPTKMLRYWKMKCRRFRPVDDATHQFFVDKTKEMFGTSTPAWTSEFFIKYLGKDALGWRKGMIQDLGQPFFNQWFDTYWRKYHSSKLV
jgi:hypothetical protein